MSLSVPGGIGIFVKLRVCIWGSKRIVTRKLYI